MLFSDPAMLSKEPPPMRWLARKVIFDKAGDGALVGDGGVDGVLFGPGRDDDEGHAGAVSAAALGEVQFP